MKKKMKMIIMVSVMLFALVPFVNYATAMIVPPPPPDPPADLEVSDCPDGNILHWQTYTLIWYAASGYAPDGYDIKVKFNGVWETIRLDQAWYDYVEIRYNFHRFEPGDYLIRITVRDDNPDPDENTVIHYTWVHITFDSNHDSDGDGLTDYDEINEHNTDPLDDDSDDDDHSDYIEVVRDMDPNDNSDGGDRFALIVAINDYKNWDDITCPLYHANWWYDLLNDQGYQPSHITMLLDSEATESNIEDALEEIGGKSGKKIDIIFLGHGGKDQDEKYFYGGWDSGNIDIYSHKVTSEEIYDSIKDADVDEIYFNIGTCYSGNLIEDLDEKSWNQKILIHTAERKDKTAKEYVPSGDQGYNLFEWRFLESSFYNGFNNSPAIDLSTVFEYTEDNWPYTYGDIWYSDFPQTWDNLEGAEIMYL